MAVKKSNTSTTKAKPWDPNSEKQWNVDKAAGGAAWALRFLELARAKPGDYALQGWIDDAEKLFEGNRDELRAFYATIQRACLGQKAPDDSAAIDLIHANDLACLAEDRASNADDSTMLTLLVTIRDKIQGVCRCFGIPFENGAHHG